MDEVLREASGHKLQWQPRNGLDDSGRNGNLLREVTRHCAALFEGLPLAHLLHISTTLERILRLKPPDSVRDTLSYCSTAYLKMADARLRDDAAAIAQLSAELKRFGECDPCYGEALERYIEYFRLHREAIPYRSYTHLSDSVEALPDTCTLAIVGDWGTGQAAARTVLERIAGHQPDIVIHLGDIYYSGTAYEAGNYFLRLFEQVFRVADFKQGSPRVYTMAGNHDMYSGGKGYYWLLDQIGQPRSFFCLRNSNWSFVAVDTGVNDYDPFTVNSNTTTLKDSELLWLKDKVNNAGDARTILLSHHPLFSAYERIDGKAVNEPLHAQVKELLPHVTAWYWAHEHNLVLYREYLNIHARCAGHGAFPVAVGEIGPPHSDVPFFSEIRLSEDHGMYQHGFVIVGVNGKRAVADYYQCDASGNEDKMYSESLDQLP
ncbi:MAG: metallophosphoesterase family protein [Candidatus Binataceae bacterium]